MKIIGKEEEILELLSSIPNTMGEPHPTRKYIEEMQNLGYIWKFHGYPLWIKFEDVDKKDKRSFKYGD